MTNAIRIHVEGTTIYCPDCGRWLLEVHEDGTTNLNAKASFTASIDGVVEEDERGLFVRSMAPRAICNLRLCRLRRWWRER